MNEIPSEAKRETSETPTREVKNEDRPTVESPREESSVIQQALAAADRLEKANAEYKKLLDKQEKMMSENLLSGKAFAGQQRREETPKDKAKEFWKGSPVEKALETYG